MSPCGVAGMSEALTRAELEQYHRDELVDFVLELQHDLRELEERVREDFNTAASDRAQIRAIINEEIARLEQQDADDRDTLHRERNKLARRVTAIEQEIGVETVDALAIAEGESTDQLTKLGRLMHIGAEGVSENPSETMRRARVIANNFDEWCEKRKRNGVVERRLASRRDDVKKLLEAERQESLAWKQVYRAMRLVADWSGGNIALTEGRNGEGKHVLTHKTEVDGQ